MHGGEAYKITCYSYGGSECMGNDFWPLPLGSDQNRSKDFQRHWSSKYKLIFHKLQIWESKTNIYMEAAYQPV